MNGTGVPLATPFDENGNVNEANLRQLVNELEQRGVDFFVPCGSNSEAALMSVEERATVTKIVTEESDGRVLAGTGHPGFRETLRQTELAADAGANAALVVTPFYHKHDQETLSAYYRDLADASPIPIYLYSVPKYTDTRLEPWTVEQLASHENVAGMKDSSGDLGALQRIATLTEDEDFDVLVGSGSIYAAGLEVGASGGVLALANVAPEAASEIYRRHADGDVDGALTLNRDLVALNYAVTGGHGVPGLKTAMNARGLPAGDPRRPLQTVDPADEAELATLVADADLG
ncbi:MAG: 4-hydroxy-tetrahydrodipicolinate synthase [Natrialbaceae archaeon]|jgi:4-hydroxy-tetrahydrodipicolinate synthase